MITSAQYSIDGTAVRIAAAANGYRQVHVHVIGNAAIYVNGTNNVTTTNGFYIDKNAGPQNFQVGPHEELWAIAGGTPQAVTVLITGP